MRGRTQEKTVYCGLPGIGPRRELFRLPPTTNRKSLFENTNFLSNMDSLEKQDLASVHIPADSKHNLLFSIARYS